jgi:hypothetical protein
VHRGVKEPTLTKPNKWRLSFMTVLETYHLVGTTWHNYDKTLAIFASFSKVLTAVSHGN